MATITFDYLSTSQPASMPGTTTNLFLCYSPDGKYLVTASFSGSTPFVNIYKRVGNVLTKLSSIPQPGGTTLLASWSGDSKKFTVGLRANPWIAVYTNNGDDTFSVALGVTPAFTASVYHAALSSDGLEMAVGQVGGLSLRRFDGTNWNIVSGGFDTTYAVENSRVVYSKNNQYIIASHAAAPWFSVYKRNPATNNFNRIASPAVLPTAKGMGMDISVDNTIVAVGFNAAPWFYTYNFDGTTLTKRADPATAPAGTPSVLQFNPVGNCLALTHGGSPFMSYYNITGANIVKGTNPTTLPANGGDGLSWSHDGSSLVVSSSTAPYIVVYNVKQITVDLFYPGFGTSSRLRNTDPLIVLENSTAQPPQPTGTPSFVFLGFSPDGKYLAVSNYAGSTPWLNIYKRVGNVLTKLTAPTQTSAGYSLGWSGNSKILAVGLQGGQQIAVYNNNGDDTFTLQPAFTSLPGAAVFQAAVNSQGTEMALVTIQGMQIRRYNGSTWVLVGGAVDTGFSGEYSRVAYSKDDKYLVCSHSVSPWFSVYKRNAGNTFNRIATPTVNPTAKCIGIDISTNQKLVAVGLTVAPFLYVYNFDGTTLTKRDDPTLPPTGAPSALQFNPQSNVLAVTHANSPFFSYYSIPNNPATGALVKRADPPTLPVAGGDGISWTHDGSMLVVSSATQPSLVAYTVKNVTGDFFFQPYSANARVKQFSAMRPTIAYKNYSMPGFIRVPNASFVNMLYPSGFNTQATAGVFPKEYPEEQAWKTRSEVVVSFTKTTFTQQAAPPFVISDIVYPYFGMRNRVAEIVYVKSSNFKFGSYRLDTLVGLIVVNPKTPEGNNQPPLSYQNFKVGFDIFNTDRVEALRVTYSDFNLAVATKPLISVNRHNAVPLTYGGYRIQARGAATIHGALGFPSLSTDGLVSDGLIAKWDFPKYTVGVKTADIVVRNGKFNYGAYSVAAEGNLILAFADLMYSSRYAMSGETSSTHLSADIVYPPYSAKGATNSTHMAGDLEYPAFDFDGVSSSVHFEASLGYGSYSAEGLATWITEFGEYTFGSYTMSGDVQWMTASGAYSFGAYTMSGDVPFMTGDGAIKYPAFAPSGSVSIAKEVKIAYMFTPFTVRGSSRVPQTTYVDMIYGFKYALKAVAGVRFHFNIAVPYQPFQMSARIGGTLTGDFTLKYPKFISQISVGRIVIVKQGDLKYPTFGVNYQVDDYFGMESNLPVKINVAGDTGLLRSPRNLVMTVEN